MSFPLRSSFELLSREEKEFLTVFLGSCPVATLGLLYFVTYSLHRKNVSTTTKVVAEHFVLLKKIRGDLVVHRVPREWVLLEYSNNANDE